MNSSLEPMKDPDLLINSKAPIFEITTRLKATINYLTIISLVITLPMFTYFSVMEDPFNVYTIVSWLIVGILIKAWWGIKEHYVLDTTKQALMIKSKIFSKETYTVLAPFKSISSVVAAGHYKRGGKRLIGDWFYRAEIILNNGKVIPIENLNRKSFLASDMKARKFANLANVNFVQGHENHITKPIKHGLKYSFTVKRRTAFDKVLDVVVAILIILAISQINFLRHKYLRLIEVVGE